MKPTDPSKDKDAPAFDFYPERWSHGTRHLSKTERCDYLDLLAIQWTQDGLEDDLPRIARMLGYRRVAQIPAAVLEKFPVAADGRRRNAFLEKVRVEQRARIAKSRAKIEKMNAARLSLGGGGSSRASPRGPLESFLAPSSPLTPHLIDTTATATAAGAREHEVAMEMEALREGGAEVTTDKLKLELQPMPEAECAHDPAPPPQAHFHSHLVQPSANLVNPVPKSFHPPLMSEALSYAEAYSRGNTEGIALTAEQTTAWHEDRARIGWVVVKGGLELPIADWRADLRSFARAWRQHEAAKLLSNPSPKRNPSTRNHERIPRDHSATSRPRSLNAPGRYT